jgi:signal transduction histidine kinase
LSLRAKVEFKVADPPDSLLVLDYLDSGKGISPSMRNMLFLPFRTDHAEGTGLGLAIARRFLQRLGGDIEEIGSKDHGVHFVMRIPSIRKSTG